MARVGLSQGNNSYDTVRKALDNISDDVHVDTGVSVLIKPNMVLESLELAATPVGAVQATIDFLIEKGVRKFIVAEGTAANGDTMSAFERFGYLSLKEKYDIEFRDLNQDEYIKFEVLDVNLKPVSIRLAKSCLDSYLVSVARMKTHVRVIATLSIKNVAIGAILDPDRNPARGGLVSHDSKSLNLSITRIAQAIVPQLAINDGVVGMQGNGPVEGVPISSGVAVAGTDALAVDRIGARIMGFDPRTIGYLWYLSQLRGISSENIQVVGDDISQCINKYNPHENFVEMLGWWVKDWCSYVDGDYLH